MWTSVKRTGEPDPVWVTFDTEQAHSLLANEQVVFIPEIPPRGYTSLARSLNRGRSILRDVRPSRVISTGPGIALAFLPAATYLGIPALFIESAARTLGPSLTGRTLAKHPRVKTVTQVRAWADEHWAFRGSVFDQFVPAASHPVERPVRSVVVTLGTQPFPFERLIRRLEAIIPADVEIFWQIGETPPPSRGEVATTVPQADLAARCRAADVVVGHAGAGTILVALEAGHVPVTVPRAERHGEHIDDHQQQLCDDLGARGIVVPSEPEQLDWSDLIRAANMRVALDPTRRMFGPHTSQPVDPGHTDHPPNSGSPKYPEMGTKADANLSVQLRTE